MRVNRTMAFCILAIALAGPAAAQDSGSHIVLVQSGEYGIRSNKLDPRKLGVAIYPGAQVRKREDSHGSEGADLGLQFGKTGMQLFAQEYVTPDGQEKVISFYKQQLAKYGPVLECRDNKPVGPGVNGLKCSDGDDKSSVDLKAGSEENQHIVGIQPDSNGTRFGIVVIKKTKRGEL